MRMKGRQLSEKAWPTITGFENGGKEPYAGDVDGLWGWLRMTEDNSWPMGGKETGVSVPQPHGTEFCQQSEHSYKQIPPRAFW